MIIYSLRRDALHSTIMMKQVSTLAHRINATFDCVMSTACAPDYNISPKH